MASSWTIGGLSLPQDPTNIKISWPAYIKEIDIAGDPILISFGSKADKLQLEGWIRLAGQTKDQLETTYILPYRNMRHTQVTVAAPGTRYDGDWIMDQFEAEERGGNVVSYYFKMLLVKGGQHIVI